MSAHPVFEEMFSKIFGAPAPQNVKPIAPPEPLTPEQLAEGDTTEERR